jgi:hypothetical protein
MTFPDTTEAVIEAIYHLVGNPLMERPAASAAIAADRKALEEQGYAIVKVGEIPPWMEEVDLHSDSPIRIYGQATDEDSGFLDALDGRQCSWFCRIKAES